MASLIVKVVIVGDESGFLYQLEYADLMVTQENIMKAEEAKKLSFLEFLDEGTMSTAIFRVCSKD
ncbi:hypothetical protein HPP92_019059 [Vanilla planifolia]|uniref:Uncharacterized protein n=1 Tax=Vanilla planifolia TaxID=51239 RepID=A0A835Q634_VANPL|nr:hypothetical protein HPP92_019059 [Vanilla planifolia]